MFGNRFFLWFGAMWEDGVWKMVEDRRAMLLSRVCVVGFQHADTAPVDEDLLEDRILSVTCGKGRLCMFDPG